MESKKRHNFYFVILLSIGVGAHAHAARMQCPDAPDQIHAREITATSAPEVKLRTRLQDDSSGWKAAVRPLISKAVSLAKAERAASIESGVENGCKSPQIFIGQLTPTTQVSGCDHRIVTRPADEGHVWVQVIAICKYTSMCCTMEEPAPAGTKSEAHAAGVTLEGPITGQPASPSTSAPAKSSKH